MTDNINFTSFKAFVMAQDESKVINHSSWETCSVGDYMRSISTYIPSGVSTEGNYVALTLCDNNEVLRDLLADECSYTNNMLPTYKELQAVLTDYEEGMI